MGYNVTVGSLNTGKGVEIHQDGFVLRDALLYTIGKWIPAKKCSAVLYAHRVSPGETSGAKRRRE